MNTQAASIENGNVMARAYLNRRAGLELFGAIVSGSLASVAMVYLESHEHFPPGPLAFSFCCAVIAAVSFLGLITKHRHGSDELSKCCYAIWMTLMICSSLTLLLGEFGQLLACGMSTTFLGIKIDMLGSKSHT